MDNIYKRLAEHLDRLPAGFPATESGVEQRILKRLFSPREAGIALGLSMKPERISTIARRLKMDETEVAQSLDAMSRKGLLVRMERNGRKLYMAAQFVIGIWEYHVNDLDESLIHDVNEYLPYFMKRSWLKHRTKQSRVIPVSKSISAGLRIMPYEAAEEIIKSQSKIVVAPCICRKEHAMVGKGCNRPLETCLVFGGSAHYYEGNGIGRSISQAEALEILSAGMEAGLVLQPGNSRKPANICMCCGCCCQILRNLKALDNPSTAVCTNFFAAVDEQACTACGRCVDACQMDAICVEDTAHIDMRRCIGCGLCVGTCEFDAVAIQEKDPSDRYVPPETVLDTYRCIAKERGMR